MAIIIIANLLSVSINNKNLDELSTEFSECVLLTWMTLLSVV